MAKIEVKKVHSFTGHKDCIYAMEAYTANEFFTSGSDKLVVKWDLNEPDKGELIATVQNTVYALKYLKEYNQLLVGENFSGIHLIDIENKKEIKSLKLTEAAIFSIQWHEGKIFVATGDGKLIVVDYQTFSILKEIELSDKSLRTMAVNPETQEIACGFSDNFIRILDLNTFNLKHEIEAHKISVFSLTYSPDFQILLSGSRDAHLKLWEVNQNYQLKDSIVAHMFTINDISYREDGKYFATCSKDKSVKVWDGETFQLLKVIDKARHAGHGTSVNKVGWFGTGNTVVSCSDDKSVSVWKVEF
ncbi:WD40 repeat domain-containing protein [Flexithrix dorotheae]|uniref:WD40 repeat domain-containing protein n=1 Tax=Flexithrix dorotheae TaxID=70993 RepID=UPI00035D1255|nr:WD40 repeat domain-containing protein [Flexithrix dorotheae]